MAKMTVEYTVSEEQVRRLEALLPFYNCYIGTKHWTVEELLRSILTDGSEDSINSRLHYKEQMIAAINETPAAGTAGESID